MRPPVPRIWRSRSRGAPINRPWWRRARPASAAAVAVTVLGLVLSSSAASAAPAEPTRPGTQAGAQPDAAAGSPPSLPLTLVTGDTVYAGLDAGGEPVVHETVQAEHADRGPVTFYTLTRDDSVYAVPSDALELLEAGVLDWELFNLAKLAAQVMAGTVDEVPVIVTHSGGRPAQVAGAAVEKRLSSINATSMSIDGDGQWWQRVRQTGAGAARSASAGALAGVEKIWLNELAKIHLDESVPQIGAPTAWDAGYDGSGVTVAVLDTGIDPDHPDVAGEIIEQVDFTGSPNGPVDRHGHGTHVAATIAGTGAASDGQRPGVAPGASLAIGRVCGDDGSCPADAIIAGMEWAAQSGFPVVNMSLGGGPTDGTDPLSTALNRLSRQHGTLFVTSAGNAGPGPETVGAPGVADESLSVAAVDKLDEMAEFSSRGPRPGDGGFKPDIAAPGVGIVAARAAGTAMGTPVDDHYTAANGTSMAAPHVAGAAALVAQQQPDLTGRELKSSLMSSALDLGHDIFAQGAGRVSAGNAVDPSLLATGDLGFGRFAYPHEDVVARTVTYTNFTDAPITLTLAGALGTYDGTPATDGLVSLDADQVTVPANGTAEVEVTLDTSVLGEDGPYGPYRGQVTATDDAGAVRATLQMHTFLEPQRHKLTVEITNPPDGAEDLMYEPTLVVPMDDRVHVHEGPYVLPAGPAGSGGVFGGTYAVAVAVYWYDAGGTAHQALIEEPEVAVDGPMTVTLDMRRLQPERVDLPQPTELHWRGLDIQRTSATGKWTLTGSVDMVGHPADEWWVLPSGPVTQGTFQYYSHQIRAQKPTRMTVLGRGKPLRLNPEYTSLDATTLGERQVWQDGDEEVKRRTRIPVPKLVSRRPLPVVDGGSGTPADMADLDLDGALVLMRPLDLIFDNRPNYGRPRIRDDRFEKLQRHVAAAADAGAVGVLVANDTGHVDVGGPSPFNEAECPDGPESCPPVRQYAALPILGIPAGAADRLTDRLAGSAPVRVRVEGDGEVDNIYALGYTHDHVPAGLPHEVRDRDLDTVEHHLHSDRPGETRNFTWSRTMPGAEDFYEHILGDRLPRMTSQRSVTVLVGPRVPDAVDKFRVGISEYVAPFVPADPGSGPSNGPVGAKPDEIVELVLGKHQEVSWNTGPEVPMAAPRPVTDSGFEVPTFVICSACRAGDRLVPTMFLGSSGATRASVMGILNGRGVAFMLGSNACEPPECEMRMFDATGTELEQQLLPVQFSYTPGGIGSGLPDADLLSEEEGNR